jgi:hypothetical protein
MKFTVIGAGMAGLLAAAILRDECEAVIEKQDAIPNNHSALLRFRSSVVGDALNIPFREVSVMKSLVSTGNPVRDAIAYSMKTNGTASLRSIMSAEGKIEKRFIAPPDFISKMAAKVTAPIHFGMDWVAGAKCAEISTIPMPLLMDKLSYQPRPKFPYVEGWVLRATLEDCDVCATLYFPGDDEWAYRASITGNQLIIEYTDDKFSDDDTRIRSALKPIAYKMMKHFGLRSHQLKDDPILKRQKYAKILPINDEERKRFILWASEHHGIYSFGRFATWRPGLLLDDLINDLRIIQRIARHGSYDHRRV